MTASIFGSRFYSHREPAWHNLGLVLDEPVGAREAFTMIGGYEVRKVPLILDPTAGLENVTVGQQAIVRMPTPDDPEHRVFGIVSEGYGLIDAWDLCDIWDEHVGEPAETVGSLGNGETFFITTKLPTFAIKGDEVENYLLSTTPMTGGDAAEARVTPVRVVCKNTLIASARVATENYRIIHDQHAKVRMAEWLTDIWQKAQEKAEALETAFNIMANARLSRQRTLTAIKKIYPEPRPLRLNAPDEILAERRDRREYGLGRLEVRRSEVLELFRGAGTGMDIEATGRTAWGLYNAVTEMEDYRRGRGDESIAKNALFGGRAETKALAFDVCLETARS